MDIYFSYFHVWGFEWYLDQNWVTNVYHKLCLEKLYINRWVKYWEKFGKGIEMIWPLNTLFCASFIFDWDLFWEAVCCSVLNIALGTQRRELQPWICCCFSEWPWTCCFTFAKLRSSGVKRGGKAEVHSKSTKQIHMK